MAGRHRGPHDVRQRAAWPRCWAITRRRCWAATRGIVPESDACRPGSGWSGASRHPHDSQAVLRATCAKTARSCGCMGSPSPCLTIRHTGRRAWPCWRTSPRSGKRPRRRPAGGHRAVLPRRHYRHVAGRGSSRAGTRGPSSSTASRPRKRSASPSSLLAPDGPGRTAGHPAAEQHGPGTWCSWRPCDGTGTAALSTCWSLLRRFATPAAPSWATPPSRTTSPTASGPKRRCGRASTSIACSSRT